MTGGRDPGVRGRSVGNAAGKRLICVKRCLYNCRGSVFFFKNVGATVAGGTIAHRKVGFLKKGSIIVLQTFSSTIAPITNEMTYNVYLSCALVVSPEGLLQCYARPLTVNPAQLKLLGCQVVQKSISQV